jgi:hypothetical protein
MFGESTKSKTAESVPQGLKLFPFGAGVVRAKALTYLPDLTYLPWPTT